MSKWISIKDKVPEECTKKELYSKIEEIKKEMYD
jgi:hypothetical protein